MNNFSLSIWLKQHRLTVTPIVLSVAIATYNTPAKSQPPNANLPSSANLLSETNVNPSQQEAVQVIRDYYHAIARRNYKQAYSAWARDGAASQKSFQQFKQGFANTKSTAVKVGKPGELNGAAGSSYIEIPVTVTAITKNGTRQRFRGSYVLRRINDVPGSTAKQRRWHLYSAKIAQVN
jgi:hypothetical protein